MYVAIKSWVDIEGFFGLIDNFYLNEKEDCLGFEFIYK